MLIKKIYHAILKPMPKNVESGVAALNLGTLELNRLRVLILEVLRLCINFEVSWVIISEYQPQDN